MKKELLNDFLEQLKKGNKLIFPREDAAIIINFIVLYETFNFKTEIEAEHGDITIIKI